MNKVKWSFSLIFAIFLVGILSTAAFASDMYNLKTVQTGSDLEVSFTGNTSNDIAGEKFDLLLKNGSTTVGTYQTALDSLLNGTFTIPLSAITSNKSDYYTVELYYSDNQGNVTGSTLARLVVSHNNTLYHTPDTEVDVNGSGLVNSNTTGFNNLKKQRTGQKVHGFYQNNTNSCASCHQTHTAKEGDSLLFKDGVYSTCSACHDGTTGAFNSFSTTPTSISNNVAGTFDVSADTLHGSLHQADGSLDVSAAPGANSDDNSKIWDQSFDCASCHAPHGGGTAEENNLNIDPLGWGGVQYVANGTKDQQNGKLFKGISVHTSVPTTKGDPYILVRFSATAGDISTDYKNIGFLYSRAGVQVDDQVIQTYRWDDNTSKYVRDYSLWLRDQGYKDPNGPFQKANTVLYNGTTDITAKDMTVVWRDGFAFGTGVANVDKADISLGIDVETTGDVRSLYDSSYNVLDSQGNVDVTKSYIPDSGVEMTKYCTACHTDYMTDLGTGDKGTLTAYHRHTSYVDAQGKTISGISDQFTCARCHFAHGTKASIMKDVSDNTAAADAESLSTTNHSSALRRYINMDSCYTSGCHSSNNTEPLYLAPLN